MAAHSKDRLVTAFGRTWSHRQFHGLVRKLVRHYYVVIFAPDELVSNESSENITAHIYSWETEKDLVGYGKTLWLALCDAVENGERPRWLRMCEAAERMEGHE